MSMIHNTTAQRWTKIPGKSLRSNAGLRQKVHYVSNARSHYIYLTGCFQY